MDDKIIELKYCRRDFEEIYYRNGGDKTFWNHHFKKERYTFIIIGTAFLLTLIYSLSANRELGFIIFLGILLCLAFFDLYKKASPGIKWKSEVKNYLDNLDKIKNNRLILTKNAFSLIQDKKETIEKWTEFKKAEMEGNFISLISTNSTYLIPKKSMTPDEFQFLSSFVSEKIKNEL